MKFLQLAVAEQDSIFPISFLHCSVSKRASPSMRSGLFRVTIDCVSSNEMNQREMLEGLDCKMKGKKVKKQRGKTVLHLSCTPLTPFTP